MALIFLGFVNHINNATLSGPGWSNIDRIKSRDLWSAARHSSSSAAINIDLERLIDVQRVSVHAHNLTPASSVRVTAGSSPGAADILDITHNYNPSYDDFLTKAWDVVIHSNVTARYFSVEIASAEPIDLGRIGLWSGVTPAHAAAWGASWGVQDSSASARSLGGDLLYAKRPRKRACNLSFPWLSDDETKKLYAMMLQSGTVDEVLVDTGDYYETILGHAESIPEFERVFIDINRAEIRVIER